MSADSTPRPIERSISITLHGLAVSPGVALATALVVEPHGVSYVRRLVHRAEIAREIERVRSAIASVVETLRQPHDRQPAMLDVAEGNILEAYAMMLSDPMLCDDIAKRITDDRYCAEWAVTVVMADFAKRLASQPDEYLKERSHDLNFLGERLLRVLTGAGVVAPLPLLTEPTVLVAADVFPADLVRLASGPLVGVAIEKGSRTTHAALVARSLEIAAVFGVQGLCEHVFSGDAILIDGTRGSVTIRPTHRAAEEGRARAEQRRVLVQRLRDDIGRPGILRSGEPIELLGNIEHEDDTAPALKHGAQGVGLFRTEYLFLGRTTLPCEEEQLDWYSKVIQQMNGRPVVFRSLDIGGDKPLASLAITREPNPALGMRAVRMSLQHPDIFLAQLRAFIRASSYAPSGMVKIMVPMVSSLREWMEVKSIFKQALSDVDKSGAPRASDIPLGMMIEVPAAAILADLLVRHAAFVSVGTNDLIQYTLAADRSSPVLAPLASQFDPAVMRLLRTVATAAKAAARPASVCGAMASDPMGAVTLVGLGFSSLSMEPAAIPRVKESLARVDLAETIRASTEAIQCGSSEEVEAIFMDHFGDRLADLIER